MAYVVTTFPDGTIARGSGILVGRNDLLTATHVVFNPARGGLATEIEICLGAQLDPESGTLLDAVATYTIRRPDVLHFGAQVFSAGSNDTVTDAEAANDMAIVGLPQDIGFDLGWAPLAEQNPPAAFLAESFGYPSAFSGLARGSVSARFTGTREVIYSTSQDAVEMGSGSSGGPLLYLDSQGRMVIAGVKSGVGDTEAVWSNLQLHLQALRSESADNNSLIGAGALDAVGTANHDQYSAQSGAVYWNAGAGDDRFLAGWGNHFFAGGSGTDTLNLALGRDAIRFETTTSGLAKIVAASIHGQSVVIDSVERIECADQRYASDLDANPGLALKLVGAVLGPSWTQNGVVMGIAIDLLDSGMPPEDLIELGLTTEIAQTSLGREIVSDQDSIDLVFRNIVGRAPTEPEIDFFVRQIGPAPGGTTLPALILSGADHPLNLENIDLVGLSYEGLWFI